MTTTCTHCGDPAPPGELECTTCAGTGGEAEFKQCGECHGTGCPACNFGGEELPPGTAGVCPDCQGEAPPGRRACFACVPTDGEIDLGYRLGVIARRFRTRDEQLEYVDRAAGALFASLEGHCAGLGIGSPAPPAPAPVIYLWRCPWCDPATGRWADGAACHHCHGLTLTNDVDGWDEAELTPAPVPPAVMRRPCIDCALRRGSPEAETGTRITAARPFWCHHGLVRVGDGYVAPATVDGVPLGAMLCGGWYALATGRPLPVELFRDPGGADRHGDAPAIASG